MLGFALYMCRNIKRSAKTMESWSSYIKQIGNLSLKVEYYQYGTYSFTGNIRIARGQLTQMTDARALAYDITYSYSVFFR